MKRRILILCFTQMLFWGAFSQTNFSDTVIYTFTVKPTANDEPCVPNKYKKFIVLESNHKQVISSIYISNTDIQIDIDDSKTYIVEGKTTFVKESQFGCGSSFNVKQLIFIKSAPPKILIRKKIL